MSRAVALCFAASPKKLRIIRITMARDRTQRQKLADFAANAVLRLLIGLALALPYRWRVPLMGKLTRHVIAPIAGYRARARENLALIFPDLALPARHDIADQACDNAGRTLIENYSSRQLMARMQGVQITGPGDGALQAAHAAGQPVILVTGHFGNYEAGRAALVGRGYAIGGLYRPMRNSFFNEHYVRTMEAFGGPIFPQGTRGTAGFVRHLKAGGQLVLLFDQNVVDGRRLDFLGFPAATATSAADLALRYGALLIPFYATRQPDGLSFCVELEEPVAHSDAVTMTQGLNNSLGARIRKNPGQWFWIHRRWK
jgi:KDO2-lipid IV(A) lauroyltransferase